ncbi:flagellar export chaperone FliS [Paenibacillus aquistagni]|uniref:flagellar export chaperone FliS n=1 Tax=Paenibacillus aquistagni TaxID=1852522 RepID=UPI00145B025D|nr:flagellar export chaperone FliS [Paenibacillus aquistagni]NMM54307.1 flagellar export chaperone FliS [Paenibacillus aquistagni]
MYAPATNGYQAYQRNKYETASPHRLTLMLYDGGLRFIFQARTALEQQQHASAHQFLLKAQDVIYELISSLNEREGGELAANLKSIYLYIIDILVQANMTKQAESLQEAADLLTSIRQAWEQIGKEQVSSTGTSYA